MIRKILVPLDGSTFGEHALPLAAAIARRVGASLRLAHVHVPAVNFPAESGWVGDVNVDGVLRSNERRYLQTTAHHLTQTTGVEAEVALLDGAVSESLNAQSHVIDADLIVLTTHARGPLGRLWQGSFADQLVVHADIPVLLVHAPEGAPHLDSLPELPRILVALDGTPLAEEALEPALELAKAMGAECTLLRVIKPATPSIVDTAPLLNGGYVGALLDRIDALQDELKASAAEYLDGMARPLRSRGLTVRTAVIAHEEPAAAIATWAREHHMNLIALATHGRHGMARLFLGSVADQVLRRASTPILIYRHHTGEEREAAHERPAASGTAADAGCPKCDCGGPDDAEPGFYPGCCHSLGRR